MQLKYSISQLPLKKESCDSVQPTSKYDPEVDIFSGKDNASLEKKKSLSPFFLLELCLLIPSSCSGEAGNIPILQTILKFKEAN